MDKIRHIQLREPDLRINLEHTTYEMVRNIHAQCIDVMDEAIIQACIRMAREVGLTDLFLIDRKFVIDALNEKITREMEDRDAEFQHRQAFCRTNR